MKLRFQYLILFNHQLFIKSLYLNETLFIVDVAYSCKWRCIINLLSVPILKKMVPNYVYFFKD